MLVLKVIIIVSLISSVFSLKLNMLKSQNDLRSTSKAIGDFVKKQYVDKDKVWHLDFFIIEKNCEIFAVNVIGNILKNNDGYYISKIHFIREINETKIKLSNSAIFFVEKSSDVVRLNEQIEMTNIAYMKFQHLVIILEKGEIGHINENPNNFHDSTLLSFKIVPHHEIFFHATGKIKTNFRITTIERFNKFSCHSFFTKINDFIVKNQSWRNDNFELIESKNFNNCEFIIHEVLWENQKHTSTQLTSMFYDFFTILNSTLKVKILLMNSDNFKSIRNFEFIRLDTLKLADDKDLNNRFVYKFLKMELTLIIHIGDSYDSYEKFYLPFDFETWIWCGITFACSFLVIFIINLLKSRRAQQLVYGNRVQNPAFNIMIAFFGQSQNILPTRSFARFILMAFILFCLIIRNGYQGVQFDLMYKVNENMNQFLIKTNFDILKDVRKPTPSSIEEYFHQNDKEKEQFIEKQLELYKSQQNAIFVRREHFEKTWEEMKTDEIEKKIFQNKMNSSQEVAPRLKSPLNKPSQIFKYAYYEKPVKFLENNIQEFYTGYSIPRNSPLSKMFLKNIQILHESGIFENLYKKYDFGENSQFKKLMKLIEDPPSFVPLNLTMLEAGFVIWLVSVAISIVIFFVEIVYFYSTKHFGKTKQNIRIFSKKKAWKRSKKLAWKSFHKFKISKTISKLKLRNNKKLKVKRKKKVRFDLMTRIKCWLKI